MRRVLAVFAVVAFVGCSGGDSDDRTRATTATTQAGDRRPMPYYLPSFLPFGFKLVRGGELREGPARPALAVALGRPDGDGRFTDVILVLVYAAAADREMGPNQRAAVRAVDVNGTQARLLESGVVGTSIDWFANGLAVGVSGPIGTAALVTDVAKRVRLGSDVATTSVDGRPDGYVTVAESRFEDRDPEEMQSLSVATETGVAISISITRISLPLVFVASGGDRVSPTRVRGHDALVSVRLRQLESGRVAQSTIVWHEHADVAVTITGSTSADSLMPIAEGMATVSEQEWRSAVPS